MNSSTLADDIAVFRNDNFTLFFFLDSTQNEMITFFAALVFVCVCVSATSNQWFKSSNSQRDFHLEHKPLSFSCGALAFFRHFVLFFFPFSLVVIFVVAIFITVATWFKKKEDVRNSSVSGGRYLCLPFEAPSFNGYHLISLNHIIFCVCVCVSTDIMNILSNVFFIYRVDVMFGLLVFVLLLLACTCSHRECLSLCSLAHSFQVDLIVLRIQNPLNNL